MESVFKYFQKQERDFDNKKYEVGECEGNSSKNNKRNRKKRPLAANKITKKFNNVGSNQQFNVNIELLGTKNDSKKSDNSTKQHGMNEYVATGKSGEALKDVKEIKGTSLEQVWNKRLTTCNKLDGTIRLVTRLFKQEIKTTLC